MKIAVGLFYLESNTFNPNLVTKENYIFETGMNIIKYLHIGSVCKENNITLFPLILASTLPGGKMKEEDYWFFANKMLEPLKKVNDLDGIWLHLHGAMEVENIGSGDLRLLKEIRKIVGYKIPISVVLDAHANIDAQIISYANIIRGYHTIPHRDQPEAERLAMEYLIRVIQDDEMIVPSIRVIPAIVSGEKGLSERSPLKELLEIVNEYEQMKEILTASVFMGDPWCDCPNSHMSVVVVPSKAEYKKISDQLCNNLADQVFKSLKDFDFEVPTLIPRKAIELALDKNERPIFLSDAGDNTTGGAVGEGTEILRLMIEEFNTTRKKVLITPIYDPKAFNSCTTASLGKELTISIGTGRDETSIPVKVTGILSSKGKLLGYLNTKANECGECYKINIGNIDVMISNIPTSFITPDHFKAAGVSIDDYDIIVLKQGYLFSELRPYSKGAIMAATKGATYLFVEKLNYENLIRPIIPLDILHSYTFE